MDGLAQRYSVLPSHLLREGDTFDLLVMDVAHTWITHKQGVQNNKDVTKNYNMDDLQAQLDKVRNG